MAEGREDPLEIFEFLVSLVGCCFFGHIVVVINIARRPSLHADRALSSLLLVVYIMSLSSTQAEPTQTLLKHNQPYKK